MLSSFPFSILLLLPSDRLGIRGGIVDKSPPSSRLPAGICNLGTMLEFPMTVVTKSSPVSLTESKLSLPLLEKEGECVNNGLNTIKSTSWKYSINSIPFFCFSKECCVVFFHIIEMLEFKGCLETTCRR